LEPLCQGNLAVTVTTMISDDDYLAGLHGYVF
jgi:hypothetical protein